MDQLHTGLRVEAEVKLLYSQKIWQELNLVNGMCIICNERSGLVLRPSAGASANLSV